MEQWNRDTQLGNYIYERPLKATVRRESSAALRGHLCVPLLDIEAFEAEQRERYEVNFVHQVEVSRLLDGGVRNG